MRIDIPMGKKQSQARSRASIRKKSDTIFFVFLTLGIILIAWSFFMEINFHYIQGFMPCCVDQETFWKMEAVVASTSTALIVIGTISIIVAIYFKKKGTEFYKCAIKENTEMKEKGEKKTWQKALKACKKKLP